MSSCGLPVARVIPVQLHSATAVEAARSTVRGIPRMPVLCTVPYPASYAHYCSLKAIYIIL